MWSNEMKVAVFGLGYVGLSNAILLARYNKVVAVDIVSSKVDMVNNKISPLGDRDINDCLQNSDLDLIASTDRSIALDADYVIVATPTNFDPSANYFDTSSVEEVIEYINQEKRNKETIIIIKSTIPIGFVSMCHKRGHKNVIFMPEFLREGKALYDNLHPTRLVIGTKSKLGKSVAKLYQQACLDQDVPVLFTNPTEAECIKLFANTYLAMRVAFFNELDTFASYKNLETRDIIDGVTLDPRIGAVYCNPSFGYGGYCLPKDTKQLLANYSGIPQKMISAIVASNSVRLDWIAQLILESKPKIIGIYRLIMKSNSDNFRSSAMLGVISRLKKMFDGRIVIYEPALTESTFDGLDVIRDLDNFKRTCDIICANRVTDELSDVPDKVFSRDVFHNN